MTYPHVEPDVLDEAMTDEPRRFFGQVSLDASKVALVKGQGKVPYDPAVHGTKYSILLDFTITPVDLTLKLVNRKMLNWVVEFRQVVRPSIDALSEKIKAVAHPPETKSTGWLLKAINGLWVGGEFVARPDNKLGETWTTIKFTDVYPDEAACKAAYEAYKSKSGEDVDIDPDKIEAGTPQPKVTPAQINQVAVDSFLTSFWTIAKSRANGDDPKRREVMSNLLTENAALIGNLTIDSPEVVKVMES